MKTRQNSVSISSINRSIEDKSFWFDNGIGYLFDHRYFSGAITLHVESLKSDLTSNILIMYLQVYTLLPINV